MLGGLDRPRQGRADLIAVALETREPTDPKADRPELKPNRTEAARSARKHKRDGGKAVANSDKLGQFIHP